MLYDPKWNKLDVYSLDSLIAWLETMPANEKYEFCDCEGKCLVGQYMASVGVEWDYHKGYIPFRDAWATGGKRGVFFIGALYPHTFGGALDRARVQNAGGCPLRGSSVSSTLLCAESSGDAK